MKRSFATTLVMLIALAGCIPLPQGNGVGGSGGSGGTGGSSAGGSDGGPECITDTDCPSGGECAPALCAFGSCSLSPLPLGTSVSSQIPGDCHANVCDGAGGVITVTDDSDVPSDGNTCTTDTCFGGQPTFSPSAAGTPCGVNLVCDGAGSCAGCLVDADCGVVTACATHHCQAGMCATSFTPYGGGSLSQIPSDCKKAVCNGLGGVTTIPDNTDIQDDGSVCTVDGCANGAPIHLAQNGASCGQGLVCSGASCVSGCFINNKLYTANEVDPQGECQSCDPSVSTTAWTPLADGTACSQAGCVTGGQCSAGACVGAFEPEGTPCFGAYEFAQGPPGPGVCHNGSCFFGCFDGFNVWWPSDDYYGATVCHNCDPYFSTNLFSGTCHRGFQNDSGWCSQGICYFMPPATCDSLCANCAVEPCDGTGLCYGKSIALNGTPCTEDGNACTFDYCHNALCLHPYMANGTACGPGQTCSAGMCQ